MNTVSKTPTFLVALFSMFWATSIFANNPETTSSLENIRDSALSVAVSGKGLLAAQIVSENIVVSFTDGETYYMFSPQEKILSDYILYHFGTILNDCRLGIDESMGYVNKADQNAHAYYLQTEDTLDNALMRIALMKKTEIEFAIESSEILNKDEKEFLYIKFEYICHYGRFCAIETVDLISRGHAYSASTQDSLLGKYTSSMLWTPKRAHLNAASNLFAGIFIPAGDLSSNIGNGAVMGLSLDFGYERARLMTDFGFITGITVQNDFEVNGYIWLKDSKASGNYINIGAGANVSIWEQLNIIPFISMHASSIRNAGSPAIGQGDAPANISSLIKPMAGLAIDYNIVLPFCDGEILGDTERRILFFRLKTAYSPNVYGKGSSSFDGDVMITSFGVGLYTDNKK